MQSQNHHHRLRRMQKHDLELRVLTVNNYGDGFQPLEKQIKLRQQVAPPDQRMQLAMLLTELSPPQHRLAHRKAWTLALKLEPATNQAGQCSTWGTRCDSYTALTRKSYDANSDDFTCASGTLLQLGFASC